MIKGRLFDMHGKLMAIHPEGEAISDEIVRTGNYYEAEILNSVTNEILERTKAPIDVVVDIGANIGNHSVYWSRFGCGVTAFEPAPENFRILEVNASLHYFAAYQSAIGTHKLASRRFAKLDPSNSGTYAYQDDFGPSYATPVMTLDEALAWRTKVDLLKIDVEGAELNALKSKADWRQFPAISFVMIEIKDPSAKDFLESVGYTLIQEYPWSNYLYGRI